jgi:hypothetical protein
VREKVVVWREVVAHNGAFVGRWRGVVTERAGKAECKFAEDVGFCVAGKIELCVELSEMV